MIRIMRLWENLWLVQGKRCAGCNREVELKDTAKSSYSFEVVCQDCYNKPGFNSIIVDEWSDYQRGEEQCK